MTKKDNHLLSQEVSKVVVYVFSIMKSSHHFRGSSVSWPDIYTKDEKQVHVDSLVPSLLDDGLNDPVRWCTLLHVSHNALQDRLHNIMLIHHKTQLSC